MGFIANRYRKFRYTRLGRKPRTVLAALRQARDFLVKEGEQHWVKGTEFEHGDVIDPEKPLCGSWGVCAIGAVAIVTGDMVVDTNDGTCSIYLGPLTPSPLYENAVAMLDRAANRRNGGGGIVGLNDDSYNTRTQVIEAFDEAIALADADARKRMGRRGVKVGA